MPQHAILEVRLINEDEFCIRVGTDLQTGALYYLGIDPESAEHHCSPAQGVRRLLDRWLQVITEEATGQIFYLPFDFSDESTRWLACEKSGQQITTVFGWAPVEGWSFSPSDFESYRHQLSDFQPDVPANPQTIYLPRFLSELRAAAASVCPRENSPRD